MREIRDPFFREHGVCILLNLNGLVTESPKNEPNSAIPSIFRKITPEKGENVHNIRMRIRVREKPLSDHTKRLEIGSWRENGLAEGREVLAWNSRREVLHMAAGRV